MDPKRGLVNGTKGKILQFIAGSFRPVEYIKVEFDVGNPLVVDLERVTGEYETSKGNFKFRHQFPISPSYCVTIHRAQGVTANVVLLDLGANIYRAPALAYVGVSRCKKLEGLHLISLGHSSIYADKKAVEYYNKQRFQSGLPPVTVFNQRCGDYNRKTFSANVNVRMNFLISKVIFKKRFLSKFSLKELKMEEEEQQENRRIHKLLKK